MRIYTAIVFAIFCPVWLYVGYWVLGPMLLQYYLGYMSDPMAFLAVLYGPVLVSGLSALVAYGLTYHYE
tara:strand:+ start:1331 stop:1537 length:207 start_codon:yes stop_codon:yes gene_type:complete